MESVIVLIGFIIDIIGELMLAASVIMVHSKVSKKRKIDDSVVDEIRLEKNLGIIAILLILVGSGIIFWSML